ncbi:MAG: hypothetical protein UX08_C0002G0018 [Candidatus Collierbacteria bacterium GW2011_GWB1_45_35]|uniref:Asl1-like glycosyl hydrolase catalytic domain-containing protein n=2 Tax=Candidatus Collieribacteriota TaxID=1752725 RepID=A0A0G1MYV3_9BACT|nr:MAG: hypothetical protein UW48_C0004G0028 [Microgenomates group bacterium GW2011_GWC1_44_23]KKT85982.1 MAG: hypothetical protein UW84_C0018G0006 [Candidatus Collierbacteria bacterium GW2011_GWA2_44_99]KKT95704.1 MAG: hypothetical protein UW96_C0005G0028 [Candidatus Collierbacteria bacterium GW2011_GWA1_45_15]KKU00351.1 MAG: hypothetical protein UX01_C0005G0028 [Candidatus Collierbacteria bacterium GW2011_GWB2_45_17]KKU05803.1 MAG: hypothetical protein UX08_C0002G0018 [Candidatus Collierbacte
MRILSIIINLFLSLSLTGKVLAIYDPLSVPNNKIGIHLLFPEELSQAAKIINRQGEAAWGYVTIPIQANDRNLQKWQTFLDECVKQKVIPIIRIATVPEGSNWIKPNDYDLIDFANFLNDLIWPVQNRYLIFFNEVNHSNEYGGTLSPENYADILDNAINIFKTRSEDFFILPAGLDNAATDRRNSIDWKTYLARMFQHKPDIFNRLDGWTSHAYANPDFTVRPDLSGSNKIDSFKYDLQYLRNFTQKKLPVFITETGWSNKYLSDHQIALYYQYAFSQAWSDPSIVAVTPFLLNAQDGPFQKFSFLDNNQKEKEFSATLSVLAQKGEPLLTTEIPQFDMAKSSIGTTQELIGDQINLFISLEKLYHNLVLYINQIQ